jgi:hypothetical protein
MQLTYDNVSKLHATVFGKSCVSSVNWPSNNVRTSQNRTVSLVHTYRFTCYRFTCSHLSFHLLPFHLFTLIVSLVTVSLVHTYRFTCYRFTCYRFTAVLEYRPLSYASCCKPSSFPELFGCLPCRGNYNHRVVDVKRKAKSCKFEYGSKLSSV